MTRHNEMRGWHDHVDAEQSETGANGIVMDGTSVDNNTINKDNIIININISVNEQDLEKISSLFDMVKDKFGIVKK